MAETARIDSIEVLRTFRTALVKFCEVGRVAIGEAETDVQKTLTWLETEQDSYWQHQIRLRGELVNRCKEKVREKKLFKDATGRQQSAVDEEKALAIAQRKLTEAEEKLQATRKWARRLHKELHNYKGGVSGLATMIAVDLPTAGAKLGTLALSLEKYLAANPTIAGSTAEAGATAGAGAGGAVGGMARGDTAAPAPAAKPDGFPDLAGTQVAVALVDAASGLELDTDGAPSGGHGERFAVFGTPEEADRFVAERSATQPRVRFEVYSPAGQVVRRVEPAGAAPAASAT